MLPCLHLKSPVICAHVCASNYTEGRLFILWIFGLQNLAKEDVQEMFVNE